MLFKKTLLLASTAILGLSLLTATPIFNVEAKTTQSKTTQSIPSLPFVKYDTKHIKNGQTIKYKVKVGTKDYLLPKFMTSSILPENQKQDTTENTKVKITVTIKNSKGKVVSKPTEVYLYQGEYGTTTRSKMVKGEYIVEIKAVKGLPKEGLDIESMITDAAYGTGVWHKLNSSKGDILPQGVSTVITPAMDEWLDVYIKGPDDPYYNWAMPPVNGVIPDHHSYTFTGKKVGAYHIKNIVKHEDDGQHYDLLYIKVIKAVTPSKLKLETPKTTFKPTEAVAIKASAKGGYLQYKYTYKVRYTNKETIIKDYSSSKSASFKAPTEKGDYTLTLYVKQINGEEIVKTKKVITVK
ncbi:hypothetical protein [Rummeliibacillus pycnus]|uniref:hypothetical protein n=1 Tax=Rummeliibacillus pycnus TaxID=101070 RepID=UPI0037CA6D34